MNKSDLFAYGIAVGMLLISSVIFTTSLFTKIEPDIIGGLIISTLGIILLLFLISIQLQGNEK